MRTKGRGMSPVRSVLVELGIITVILGVAVFLSYQIGHPVVAQNVDLAPALPLQTPTATPQVFPIEGQVGGAIYGVDAQYVYAFIGQGPRFKILNVSKPSNPVLMGRSDLLPGVVQDVEIVGSYAYVAAGFGGLRVIDVGDPTHFVEVGAFEDLVWANDVEVEGSYAYVADPDTGLWILDVSDPTHPTRVGLYTQDDTNGVDVIGRYAYLATDDTRAEFQVVDVLNPASPVKVGEVNLSGLGKDVEVQGPYAYVVTASGTSGTLTIVDISSPSAPAVVGDVTVSGNAYDVIVVGSRAYVLADDLTNGGYLHIVEVANPAHPSIVQTMPLGETPRGVEAIGSYVYAGDEKFHIVDVHLPSSPHIAGLYPGWSSRRAAIMQHYAFSADRDLRVVDITRPNNPRVIGAYDFPGRALDMEARPLHSGAPGFLYIAADDSGLRIIDVRHPAHPVETGHIDTWSAKRVALWRQYALVAAFSDGLRVVDITDPAHPTEVGAYTGATVSEVAVADHYAYVPYKEPTSGTVGLRIIDLSSPSHPTEVGTYTLCSPGCLTEIEYIVVRGTYAYIIESYPFLPGSSALHILDVHTPTSPTLLSGVNICGSPLDGRATELEVGAGYAFVPFDSYGGISTLTPALLCVIDVSTPSSPTVAGLYTTLGESSDVAIQSSRGVVADGPAGLLVFSKGVVAPTPTPTTSITFTLPASPLHHYLPLVNH